MATLMSDPILVIGAGISGLSCAHHLIRNGRSVLIIDKARGPGGRISSKRTDMGATDLGAQYFTARSPEFQAEVADWVQAGVVAHWSPRIAVYDDGKWEPSPDQQPRFVGSPKMGQLAHHLSAPLDARWSTRVTAILEHQVQLEDGTMIDFDHAVVACPADQAKQLLPELDAPDQAPCYAVWLDISADWDFDAAFVRHPDIGWIAKDSSKPGRSTSHRWVIHPTAQFSQANIECTAAEVIELIHAALSDIAPSKFNLVASGAHRWRYARPWDKDEGIRTGFVKVRSNLWVCGDYLLGGRVEGAWRSGRLAAQDLLAAENTTL